MKTKTTLTPEMATAEVNGWLDYKKIGPSKRESHQDHIKQLAESIAEGQAVINENKEIIYKLKFPVPGIDSEVTELKFKPRLNVSVITSQLTNIKPGDGDGRLIAYTAALTDKDKTVIKCLDTEDFNFCTSVVVFFF